MTTTEHTIKLKADAREITTAGGTIKTAFNPLTIREFRRESKQLERVMRELTAEQLKLSKSMLGVKKGTDQYKEFEKELKRVGGAAKTVQSALSGIQRNYKDLAGVQRQSFIGGAMSGAGLAQFLPAGPGGYARMGGALMGGALRRGAGAAAAPFLMPGMGGLSSLLGAIPLAGGAAQGALQAGQGMYSQAMAYAQTRASNLYFAGPQMGQLVNAGPDPEAEKRFIAAEARLQEAESGLGPAARGLGPRAMAARRRALDAKLSSLRKTGVSQEYLKRVSDEEQAKWGKTGYEAAPGVGDVVTPQDKKSALEVSRKTREDRLFQDKLIASRKKELVEASKTRTGDRIYRDTGLGAIGMGVKFGFGAQEAEGLKGAFFGARGGLATKGRGGGLEQFVEAMAVQRLYGVGQEQAGAYARMGAAGGGGMRGQMNLGVVMATAVEMGLKGSRAVELLGEMVSLGQQAEKTGVKIDPAAFLRGTGLLTGMGVAGPQAQRIAGGLSRQAMGLAERGVSTPADLMMLRAFGYDPAGGRMSYINAIEQSERGMNPEALNNLLGMASQAYQGMPEKMKAFHFKRLLGRGMGTPVGMGLATTMLRGYKEGVPPEEAFAKLNELMAKGRRAGDHENVVRRAQKAMGEGGAGALVGAAGLQTRAVGIGMQLSGMFQRLEKVGQDNVKILGNFAKEISAVITVMQDMVSVIEKFTKGGFAGIFAPKERKPGQK